MKNCRINGDRLAPLFSLGDIYVSDFIPIDEPSHMFQKGDLNLCIGKTSGLVQLDKTIDFDSMYRKYWYASGSNRSMQNELKDIVDSVCKLFDLKSENLNWLDIGCNDGTLLNFLKNNHNIIRYGCDPSDVAKNLGKNYCEYYCNNYFDDKAFPDTKFKVITAIAMFYDIENPNLFLQNIHNSLDDDGIFIIQMSYLPLMIDQLAFDNICHEHLCYYTLTVLNELLSNNGFKIVDCVLNDVNGGSFRVYIRKERCDDTKFATSPYRYVANMRIDSLLEFENSVDYTSPIIYDSFFKEINNLKKDVVEFIRNVNDTGKTVAAYGASTKGNTLLQYFGLGKDDIKYIADVQNKKHGLKTIGSEIPIVSEIFMRENRPDYLLILPWHFITEFKVREKDYLKNGGKFIVPCPQFEIIS